MNATLKKTGLLLVMTGLILVAAGGCIMEDRVIEIVVSETTCVDFPEYHTSETFVTPTTVDYAEQISQILEDNDVSREDLVSARLVSASYGVDSFPAHADWAITGAVTVQREDVSDGPDTLYAYTTLSVADALGKTLPAVLNAAGVGVLNRALADFIAGENPVLTFEVINSGVAPAPSAGDPLVFQWHGCIVIDIVAETEAEVPEPF
jgi:hypothetical protein